MYITWMRSEDELNNLKDAWLAEQREERERIRAERLNKTLKQRVEAGVALTRLEVSETGTAAGGRTLVWVELKSAEFRASPGTPVLLWWDEPKPETSLNAILARRRGQELGLVLDEFPPERLLGGEFNLDLEAPQTTYQRGVWAIKAFAEAKNSSDTGRLREALFLGEGIETSRPKALDFLDEKLNESQRKAVQHALFTEPVAYIHGPPGTGKTRTLVEVIRQSLRADMRVLVAAASNAAVDHISRQLLAASVPVLRLGHPARVMPDLEQHTLDSRLAALPDYAMAKAWMDQANAIRRKISNRSDRGTMRGDERRELYRQARELTQDAKRHLANLEDAIVSTARVISCTASSADSNILRNQEFDLVVIDEGSQIPDPIALIAARRGARLVIAGDPCQLAPTVHSTGSVGKRLASTFLERFQDQAYLLDTQYRMNALIMNYPSDAMYGGRLIAHPSVASHTLLDLGVEPDPWLKSPLMYLDTAGKGWEELVTDEDPSTSNPQQAERTVAEARRLLELGLKPEDLAIISPYYAQVRLIRALIPEVDVDTVDAFQGQEREAIIVDLVRSNYESRIGFLSDVRRMNVAMTRARRFLLVIGDSATIANHCFYEEFLEYVENYGALESAWSD